MGVLDFDECPAFYAPIVAPVPVRCFSLEKTTRHAVRPLRDEPLPPQIAGRRRLRVLILVSPPPPHSARPLAAQGRLGTPGLCDGPKPGP